MWVLVYIVLNSALDPVAINAMGPGVTFDTMYECFKHREQLAEVVGGEPGYYPLGHQAICVQTKKNSV